MRPELAGIKDLRLAAASAFASCKIKLNYTIMAATIHLGSFGTSRHIIYHTTKPRFVNHCLASTRRLYATSDRLPKIANTSVWTAMIPTFMRKGRTRKAGETKEWNPATFYIVMFTLIGSQAIRMLTLKNNYAAYSRSTDAKIELLREVIERVKNGEKVDVEKLLGTGDEAKEREWEEGKISCLRLDELAPNISA